MQPAPNLVIFGEPERIESPSKFSVYCNATEILLGAWDIRVTFMENIPPSKGQPQVLVHGSIVFSPTHAKALLQNLERTVSLYEEKFGELDIQKILDQQSAMLAASQPALSLP